MSPFPLMNDALRNLRIARSDLSAAEVLLASNDPRIRQEEICLHCHEAIERGFLRPLDLVLRRINAWPSDPVTPLERSILLEGRLIGRRL